MRTHVLVLAGLLACSSKSATDRPPAPTSPADAAGTSVDAGVVDKAPVPLDPAVIAKHWLDGCFTIRDATGKVHTNDPQRCATPRRPYSTFKLANALLAVDLGILAGADAPMTWDKQAIPDQTDYLAVWREPHTLKSGMAVSAVPYFRTLALQIGEERMRAGLEKLAYGNRDMAGGLSRFWLTRGGLRISATEQLAFVEALARGTLPVGKPAQDVVRAVVELARTPDDTTRLHGKTGSGPIEDTKGGWLVWQVGWVATSGGAGEQIVPYACWMERKVGTLDDARAAREQRLRATLDELGVFPRG